MKPEGSVAVGAPIGAATHGGTGLFQEALAFPVAHLSYAQDHGTIA